MTKSLFSIELESTKSIDFNIIENLPKLQFYSLTWHIEYQNHFYFAMDTHLPVLNLAELLIKKKKSVLLHVPCQNLTKYEALIILDRAKHVGVKYILAVRGDIRYAQKHNRYFSNTIEFVKFIKMYYGNAFSIGVTGYPRGHPLALNMENDLDFLKTKVLSGASFILTQFEFDYKTVEQFLQRCKLIQINIPIIIGVYLISPMFDRITEKCGVVIPNDISKILNPIKHNSVAVDNYAIYQAVFFIKNILLSKQTQLHGIHLYSMNKLLKVCHIYKNVYL